MISSLGSSAAQISSSLFSKLDSNNKGYIAESDLQSAFAALSQNGSSDVSELFSSLDGDSDGKVTQEELTSGVSQLLSELNSQFDNLRVQGGMPPPPPPASDEDDEGYTQDELESIASTTTDTNLASLMSKVAENFEAADTNEDGKVSAKEAMEYQRQSESANTSQRSDSAGLDNISKQIAQLISAYGETSGNVSSSLSIAA